MRERALRVWFCSAVTVVVCVYWLFFTLSSPFAFVREKVVRGLSDQPLLARVAAGDSSLHVQHAAIEALTDQALLGKIALEHPYDCFRGSAIDRLSDQALLAKVTEVETNAYIRQHAIKGGRLTNQLALAKVASGDSDYECRSRAMWNLTDPHALMHAAINGAYDDVRDIAIGKIVDQTCLLTIVGSSIRDSFRRHAMQGLTNSQALVTVLQREKDWTIRSLAVERAVASLANSSPFAHKAVENSFPRYIQMTINAVDDLPAKHRSRITEQLIRIVSFLSHPGIASVVGDMTRINATWREPEHRPVYGYQFLATGEIVTFTIQMEHMATPLSHSWSTSFPDEIGVGWGEQGGTYFIKTEIEVDDLLEDVLRVLDQEQLQRIRVEHPSSSIRKMAAAQLRQNK